MDRRSHEVFWRLNGDPCTQFELVQSAQLSPERRLWWEVLNLAIHEATREINSTNADVIACAARRWINDDKHHIGSFLWVTTVLGLEPCQLRRMVRAQVGNLRVRRDRYRHNSAVVLR